MITTPLTSPVGPPQRTQQPAPRVPSWAVTSTLVVLVAVFLVARIGTAGGLVLGFLLLTPIERIWKRHDQRIRRPGLRTDMFHLLLSGGAALACLLVPLVVWSILLLPLRGNPVATAFNGLSGWVRAPLAFLVLEVLAYWAHRLEHELPLLWRFHAVHHSSEELDWISGARVHPIEGAIVATLIGAPLLLLGVGPGTVGVFAAITRFWGVLLHMNVRWRMRALDGIWSTPDYHHWHHSNHAEARNKNYAGFLPVIDRVFGTYFQPKDRRPLVYGIDEPMPDGWVRQLRQPFVRRPRPANPVTVEALRVDRQDILRRPLTSG